MSDAGWVTKLVVYVPEACASVLWRPRLRFSVKLERLILNSTGEELEFASLVVANDRLARGERPAEDVQGWLAFTPDTGSKETIPLRCGNAEEYPVDGNEAVVTIDPGMQKVFNIACRRVQEAEAYPLNSVMFQRDARDPRYGLAPGTHHFTATFVWRRGRHLWRAKKSLLLRVQNEPDVPLGLAIMR